MSGTSKSVFSAVPPQFEVSDSWLFIKEDYQFIVASPDCFSPVHVVIMESVKLTKTSWSMSVQPQNNIIIIPSSVIMAVMTT